MTPAEPPVKYVQWHKIGLRLLLDGAKPTAQALIDRRGAGSMTTATAALNEFYERYLPSVLSAATLGAPAEIADLVGDLWTRLADHARAAATKDFDKARAQLQDKVDRLERELTAAGSILQEQAHSLETAQADAARQEARAIGAEGELIEQRRIVDDLNRALSQGHRDLDRQAGELGQARTAATDRKEELAALREEHRTALAGLRDQHRDELRRLKDSNEAAMKALTDRATAAAADHDRAQKAQDAAHKTQRDEQLVALNAAGNRTVALQGKLSEALQELAVAKEQLGRAAEADGAHKVERDRLTTLVDTLQATVRALSARKPRATKPKG